MFTCGNYSIDKGGIIDFNDLEIPCNNYIIVSLVQKDFESNNAFAVKISCAFTGI